VGLVALAGWGFLKVRDTPMDANTIASVVSAGIAVVSVLVGVYFTRKAMILQHEMKDLQRRATQLQYFAELRTWAGEAVQILAEAVHLSIMDRRVYKPGEFLRERRALLCRLSAHVDRGRWFFPNIRQNDDGTEREGEFRGFRHQIVQTLYRAYRVVGFLEYTQGNGNIPERSDLQNLQRYFAHQIQEVLDPGNFEREFRQIIGEGKGVSERQGSEPPVLARNYHPEEMAARERAEREMFEREMLERQRAETEHVTAGSRSVPVEPSDSPSAEVPPAPTISPAQPDAILPKLIRAGVLIPPLKLFRRYKGKMLEATLLADGAVEFQGQRYDTCSAAASAARASVSRRRMNTNGWTFWQYQGADGKTLTLHDARQQVVSPPRKDASGHKGPKDQPERYGLRKKFWEGLLNRPKMKGTRHADITPGVFSWIGAGGGVWGLFFRYVVRQDEGTVDLYIDRGAGKTAVNKDIFDRLHKHKEEIEKTFGSGLSWQRADKQQSCRIACAILRGGYRSDESQWPAIHDAMIDAMGRLEQALAPHLEKLKTELTS
jgi:Domain of unknown function (DUF4268)/Restriction Enzyme Adenine Methylase Associated